MWGARYVSLGKKSKYTGKWQIKKGYINNLTRPRIKRQTRQQKVRPVYKTSIFPAVSNRRREKTFRKVVTLFPLFSPLSFFSPCLVIRSIWNVNCLPVGLYVTGDDVLNRLTDFVSMTWRLVTMRKHWRDINGGF